MLVRQYHPALWFEGRLPADGSGSPFSADKATRIVAARCIALPWHSRFLASCFSKRVLTSPCDAAVWTMRTGRELPTGMKER
ncbi:hypothetical protein SAMN06265784_103236 [Paraburkholderia susongensis]|uniref:Uncharacterized protein n=1 Tax=Paraburkholderia susongensis TaxID=1515439 RepID=A0A1X7K0F6_9BURK|nr:hypothetical protein SAMN06265784_103236 [Paraburkholderia susongensis]